MSVSPFLYYFDNFSLCQRLKFFMKCSDEKAFGEDGYGAKASAKLMQVRGKDFRHEKTKKKRGAYRGGTITLNSNSFKY